jgi:Flp pilus assembly protein TadD
MSKANPGSTRESLAQVQSFLNEGQPERGIEYLLRIGTHNAELRNAYGVCLLRAGQIDKALELYQTLCLNGSICLKRDVPTLHMANYATALLCAGNLAGCQAALRQVRDPAHPAVTRIRDAIQRWRQSLTWLQRMRSCFGDRLAERPVELGFDLGDLGEAAGDTE